MGSVVSKRFSYKDPKLNSDLEQIYRHLAKLDRSTRNMDMRALAKEIGPHLPADVLLNIERYFDGRRESEHVHVKGLKDKALVRLTKFAGATSNLIETNVGASLSSTGQWVPACSRKLKKRFRKADPADLLERLLALPVKTWEYKAAGDGRHLSPT